MEAVATFVFRFIGYVFSEIILGIFFYWLGWPFVKLATLGKYPRKVWRGNSREEIYIACGGMVAFAITVVAVFGQSSL